MHDIAPMRRFGIGEAAALDGSDQRSAALPSSIGFRRGLRIEQGEPFDACAFLAHHLKRDVSAQRETDKCETSRRLRNDRPGDLGDRSALPVIGD